MIIKDIKNRVFFFPDNFALIYQDWIKCFAFTFLLFQNGFENM